jgi:hypothetical protein
MPWDFESLLNVPPEIVERETRLDWSLEYIERARRLRALAEDCRISGNEALAAARYCEQVALQIHL